MHCEKPAAYTEQRNQVSETPESHVCVSLRIKHGSPFFTRMTTTTKKRLTGKDHSKAERWDVWLVSFSPLLLPFSLGVGVGETGSDPVQSPGQQPIDLWLFLSKH